jgi:hypothetical protein
MSSPRAETPVVIKIGDFAVRKERLCLISGGFDVLGELILTERPHVHAEYDQNE